MLKNGYIGPKISPGAKLNAYGRDINPDLWDDAEKEKWFAIEPRYKAYFADASGKKNEVTKEAETKG